MGLIKAGLGAVGGVLADQWKEFFYCEAMDKEDMVTKGQKRISGRSSNTKGSDNIISNGSGIAVTDGQCMIIEYPADVRRFCCVFHPRWLINSKLRQQTTAFHTYIIAKKTLIH